MSALRTSSHIIPSGGKACASRLFHQISCLATARSPKASPRVAQKIRASGPPIPGTQRVQKKYNPEECLPPIALLKAGSYSGALPVEPNTALQILLRYQELAKQSTPGWEGTLCREFDITPLTLERLAAILNRCTGNGQKRLAVQVMLSASVLGERSATYSLINHAIRSGSLHRPTFAAPLQRLGILAKKESDREAMVLLGKVLMRQEQKDDALVWLHKACQGPVESLKFDGAGEALVLEGQILLGRNDEKGAKAAFQKSAIELDYPAAYFYLSKFEEPNSSQQQVYLLKAANAGIVEAWHGLGVIELERISKQIEKPTSINEFGMAREWFAVAAADGFGLSMLNLAEIYRSVGMLEIGLKWLESAEALPDIKEEAARIRTHWEDQNAKISINPSED